MQKIMLREMFGLHFEGVSVSNLSNDCLKIEEYIN